MQEAELCLTGAWLEASLRVCYRFAYSARIFNTKLFVRVLGSRLCDLLGCFDAKHKDLCVHLVVHGPNGRVGTQFAFSSS